MTYLKDPKGPFFLQAYNILENVSTVKSFNICLDMEDTKVATATVLKLFRTFLSIVK